jgi:hypothetical protein
MATLKDQKREILQRGLRDVLENSSIPRRLHLQMVQTLKRQIDEYRTELEAVTESHGQNLQENKAQARAQALAHEKRIKELGQRVEDTLSQLDSEIERLTNIDHLKGDPGKNAEPVDYKVVIESLLPYIPAPMEGEQGAPGKDAEVDMEELTSEVVAAIRKNKLIEITDIRNANSFIFNKKRYKFEELMRGAGGSTTTGGQSVLTQYLLTAAQAGLNVTIDLTQLANWVTFDQLIAVYRNNIPQTQGVQYNFTLSGSTLTIFSADAGEIFSVTYSYTS